MDAVCIFFTFVVLPFFVAETLPFSVLLLAGLASPWSALVSSFSRVAKIERTSSILKPFVSIFSSAAAGLVLLAISRSFFSPSSSPTGCGDADVFPFFEALADRGVLVAGGFALAAGALVALVFGGVDLVALVFLTVEAAFLGALDAAEVAFFALVFGGVDLVVLVFLTVEAAFLGALDAAEVAFFALVLVVDVFFFVIIKGVKENILLRKLGKHFSASGRNSPPRVNID